MSEGAPLQLVQSAAFARGGNRLCFVDPRDSRRCIKVQRADRSPRQKRRQAPPWKRLRRLASFDDNQQEAATYRHLQAHCGEAAFSLIPRLYGTVPTSLGPGLCSELLRDSDGRIARTLKHYLWERGEADSLGSVLEAFAQHWTALGMPSRRLLLHNIVVQCDANGPRALKVIDGLGWPDFLPLANHLPALARRKARRRIDHLHQAIAALLARRQARGDFGIHGWLDESRRLC
ncbi:YrbL family protein [Parahaliea mediterranea]|uniref:YrbL family protein n=1 Tax=Parahaliea mediterranea TaxID=651086 RepID=UPI000E2EC6E7|nr:YrbL family protein [Parahaliea mediterranea]